MTIREIIEVLEAAERGEKIQYQSPIHPYQWRDYPRADYKLNFECFKYRVKPKPIEGWINVYPGGDVSFYLSRADADFMATQDRVRCVHLREVEE